MEKKNNYQIQVLVYEKNFLCLKRFKDNASNNQNSRIYSLFCELNIHSIIVDEKNFSPEHIKAFDYGEINLKLSVMKTVSKKFLRDSIMEEI